MNVESFEIYLSTNKIIYYESVLNNIIEKSHHKIGSKVKNKNINN